jgi:nifR3 family TIM-barrel protein
VNERPDPTFFIGNIPIYGDLVLAPMDGYTDLPFRSLARSLGSALIYTEFINAIDVVYKNPKLEERLAFTEAQRPLVYQVFDDEPERLVKAALKLRNRNPDIIDINMGCSAKSVSNRGAGAGLLQHPEKIAQIFSSLSKSLDIPITGKIRLGWDDSDRNYLLISHIIEDNGGSLITVHGRTRTQAYQGSADWNAIAEVKQSVHIPVIGNGDVCKVADIERIKVQTGCDGVMIGRAALDNPWIFSRIDRENVPDSLLRSAIFEHLNQMLSFYGPSRGLVLFRKFANRYLRPLNPDPEIRHAFLTCENVDEFTKIVETIFSQSN